MKKAPLYMLPFMALRSYLFEGLTFCCSVGGFMGQDVFAPKLLQTKKGVFLHPNVYSISNLKNIVNTFRQKLTIFYAFTIKMLVILYTMRIEIAL